QIHQQDYENCRICRTPLRDGVNDNLKVVREILILFPQLVRNAIYRLDMRNRDRRLNLERCEPPYESEEECLQDFFQKNLEQLEDYQSHFDDVIHEE
ncbi:36504_t:CDS:2, partial [Gigaspora margarita]